MTQITLNHIHKTFDNNTQVINDVNLEIGAGEFCVFLGPSGCGKSTLLRMIAGIEDITAGDLFIGGTRMNDVAAAKRQVAMVFQNYALYPHMTVFENMAFGLRQAKVNKDEITARVNEAAKILQIENLIDRMPRALSGGQRQRVAIGRAIVRSPDVFLFDEPLSNLDAALRVHMRAEISRLHKSFHHASAVYVTHDQTEAMAMADKIVLLRAGDSMRKHGSIAQVGSPMDLYHRPNCRFVAEFLGSPRMNFLCARQVENRGHGIVLRLESGDLVSLPQFAAQEPRDDTVVLGIRPEHMHQAPPQSSAIKISRKIKQIERFGEYSYIYLENGTGENLIAKVAGDCQARCDETLSVYFDAASCHVFDQEGFALPRQALPVAHALSEHY